MSVVMRISLITTVCLASVFPAAILAGNCNTDTILASLNRHIDNIKTYDVTINTQFRDINSKTTISGITPNRLYLKQVLSTPDGAATITSVFDSEFQWIKIVTSRSQQIYKINLAKTTRPGRPFDTSYNIHGTGLLSGEDYPTTLKNLLSLYQLKAECTKDNISLSGNINKDKFRVYAGNKKISNQNHINKFIKQFGYIKLSTDLRSKNIHRYAMGSDKSSLLFMSTFKLLNINNKPDHSLFQFKIPKGKKAVDITESILNQ